MDLANCKECGRLFKKGFDQICSACRKKEDETFMLVKEYLRENRGATTEDVSDATEVEVTTIVRWIREGRLMFADSVQLVIPCESCGAPIRTGQYCKDCSDKLKSTISKLHDSIAHKDDTTTKGAALHIEDRIKRK